MSPTSTTDTYLDERLYGLLRNPTDEMIRIMYGPWLSYEAYISRVHAFRRLTKLLLEHTE